MAIQLGWLRSAYSERWHTARRRRERGNPAPKVQNYSQPERPIIRLASRLEPALSTSLLRARPQTTPGSTRAAVPGTTFAALAISIEERPRRDRCRQRSRLRFRGLR